LFIYSDSGKLLSYFNKKGGGPNEYIGITDFIVDNDTITVLDRSSQKLIKYNHSGDWISEHKLDYYAWAISPTVEQCDFLYCGNEYDGQNHTSKLRKMKSNQPDMRYLPVDQNEAKFMHFRVRDNFFCYQKTVYFFELFNDTVYSAVGGGIIKPTFYIDYKGKNIPESLLKRNYANVAEFRKEYSKTSYAHGVFSFVASDRYLMFCSYQEKLKLTVFDQKDLVSYTFSDIKDDICFNGLTFPVSTFYYTDKHIFFKLDASQVVEWRKERSPTEQFKGLVNATDEDDNPLFLICDFKQ